MGSHEDRKYNSMSLLNEVHFWSARDDIPIKHTDFAVLKYFNKRDSNDNWLASSKRIYCEQRGVTWLPIHKKLFKIKDKLKELEDYFSQNKIVYNSWNNNKLIFFLANGVEVTVTLNSNNDVVTDITFNKTFSFKIQPELVVDAVISGTQLVCLCTDGRVICQGGSWKNGWTIETVGKKKLDFHGDLLCIWGRLNTEHPQPWSPVIKDHQKANLLLYWIGLRGPELQAYKKTEGDPIDVIISKVQSKTLLTVEQKVSLRGAVCVEINTLELTGNNLSRTAITSVPLQTQVCCCTLTENENYLLLACIDGSVALLNRNRGSSQIIKTSIIPTLATWHSGGAIAAISNERGQIQYYDTALNRLNLQLLRDDCTPVALLDLSGYFPIQSNVSFIKWCRKDVLVMIDHGPLIVVKHSEEALSFSGLIQQYLKMGKVRKAIGLLLSWDWNDGVYIALQKIVTYLLKLALTEENVQNLKNALSSFHSSPIPLTANIKHKYGNLVRALTRRFFHQLIRHKMFETAFLLAVDIGHYDLFMDLYYCAIKMDNKEMAAAARAQASSLVSRCSSEASFCSRSECSECSDSYCESSSEDSLPPQSKLPLEFNVPPRSYNDNFLTTNFNENDPKTYQTTSFPSNENKYIKPRLPSLPDVIVKAPPLPILQAPQNSRLCPQLPSSANILPPSTFQSSNVSTYSFSQFKPAQPWNTLNVPPIPPPPSVSHMSSPVTSAGAKKQQTKVKFSDTVTAFIVPEIKRPVRIPPPPHITDPQKELADSLPLCHPNEDYLKDFTPAKHNVPDEVPSQSKIKVVHFGVV